MSLKHAVLGLVLERRGYGYDLVNRLSERLGPAWQLTPSAVYFALDQLERSGLVRQSLDGPSEGLARSGRRSARVVYEVTSSGVAEFIEWLATPSARTEPVRSHLHLKVSVAAPEHAASLSTVLGLEEERIARLRDDCNATSDPRTRLARAGVAGRLEADLEWLSLARRSLSSS